MVQSAEDKKFMDEWIIKVRKESAEESLRERRMRLYDGPKLDAIEQRYTQINARFDAALAVSSRNPNLNHNMRVVMERMNAYMRDKQIKEVDADVDAYKLEALATAAEIEKAALKKKWRAIDDMLKGRPSDATIALYKDALGGMTPGEMLAAYENGPGWMRATVLVRAATLNASNVAPEEMAQYLPIGTLKKAFNALGGEDALLADEAMRKLSTRLPQLHKARQEKEISDRYGIRTGSPQDSIAKLGPQNYDNAVQLNKAILRQAQLMDWGDGEPSPRTGFMPEME